MALSHFEQRNQLVIAEAKEIATAIQRAQMLPEPFRGNLLQLLQEYVHTRIEFGKDLDESGLQASISDTNRLQNEMWQQSVMLVKQNPNMVTPLFVQALGTSAELSDQRLVAQGIRIPSEIWLVLVLLSGLTCLIIGISMRSRLLLAMSVLPLTVAIVLSLVADLDTPRTGFIRVDQRGMEKLRLDLKGEVARVGRTLRVLETAIDHDA